MTRFKDVTKVVLVLALCFAFVGVENSAAATFATLEDLKEAETAYKDARKTCIDLSAQCKQLEHIERSYAQCKLPYCWFSASKQAANKLDKENTCALVPKARELAESTHSELLDVEIRLKYSHMPLAHVNEKNKEL